jgi:hypothetical protein
VDTPPAMYLQPGSSTSSVQRDDCPTAQVSVNTPGPRRDSSQDARRDVARRPPLQLLTKVQRGPGAGPRGLVRPSALARGHGAERHGLLRRAGLARRSLPPHPTRAGRAVQVHSADVHSTLHRRNTGRPRSKDALGAGRLAQFERRRCAVRLHSSYERHRAARGAGVGACAAELSKPTRIFVNCEPLRDALRERVPERLS